LPISLRVPGVIKGKTGKEIDVELGRTGPGSQTSPSPAVTTEAGNYPPGCLVIIWGIMSVFVSITIMHYIPGLPIDPLRDLGELMEHIFGGSF
jgi:hypothetical protein